MFGVSHRWHVAVGAPLDAEGVGHEVIREGRRGVLLHEVGEAEVARELLQEVLRRQGLCRGAGVHHVGREVHCGIVRQVSEFW